MEQLEECGIDCLYYMLPIENVPKVMRTGILSYNKVKSLPHRSVADKFVQSRRDYLISHLGRDKHIHDYVPLYFCTHTPMQYVVTQSVNRVVDQKDLTFIEIDPARVFSTRGVIFTDGNAASNTTSFYSDMADLSNLDWHVIHEVHNCYWREYKRKKAAEVLVPDHVPVDFFLRVVVFDAEVKRKLKGIVKCRCEVDRSHYH
jgi:hypothetical protein